MLVRRVALCTPRRSFVKYSQQWHIRSRQMSSAASHPPPAQPASLVLSGIASELDRRGPRIDLQAKQITILSGPKDFYHTLKEKIRAAKKRIYLSTLYVGKTEEELVSCIRDALEQNPDLTVSILTDALRGTRESPDPSCASLLASLAAEFPSRVEIRMYHTPNLTGLRKKVIPRRINEGWGLQHMKLYGVDDEVILSGANLSDDYFTNRQDRYHLFSSAEVTEYFARVHATMCSVSFLLEPDDSPSSYSLRWPTANASPSPLSDPDGYISASKPLFEPLVSAPAKARRPSSAITSLYPLLVIPHALNTELPALTQLLSPPLPRKSSYLFTAGYFNPHPLITSSLLSSAAAGVPVTVVTASPWANGFYGSKGVSGMLPAAYTLLSRKFLRAAKVQIPDGMVKLREWRLGTVGRPHGWTYHAKGLWLTLGEASSQKEMTVPQRAHDSSTNGIDYVSGSDPSDGPSVTVIGSSNYTVRSYSLDTEVGAVVVTRDPDLRAALALEQKGLLEHSRSVELEDLQGGDRKVGLGVRIAMWIVGAVGGSL